MKYDELITEARKAIPEFDAEYKRMLKEDIIDKDSGAHVVFSYAFIPLAKKAIDTGNEALCNKIFDFIEEMAKSKDKLISEVCDFTVMEELNDEYGADRLKLLLGDNSKMSLSAVSGYMGDYNG